MTKTAFIDHQTLKKFDVPGPRYTSYPVATVWTDEVNEAVYIDRLKRLGRSEKTLSLYVHIPFCQSLCRYCGCNVVVRPADEKYADEYLVYLFREIELVVGYIGRRKTVKQLHWGGGTPNYLTEGQMQRLSEKIRAHFDVDADAEVAIEIDPRTTSLGQIQTLGRLGFNRVSMGIQDFHPKVQEAVNRQQPFEAVKEIYDACRAAGFSSVNFDLIYGLPFQTSESFQTTIEKVIGLKPDRIALYSFAHVPWVKKHQRKIDEASLPAHDVKMDIFLSARARLTRAGYTAIAMDHFALEADELARAFREGLLHRNFMGYTVKPSDEFIGMGLTSIGFLENAYIHMHKALPEYYRLLREDKLPVEKGKILSEDDRVRQWVIHALMCQFRLDKEAFEKRFGIAFDGYFQREQEHIRQCVEDGLVCADGGTLNVTQLGKIFIRNVCMGFDEYLWRKGAHMRFSRTV